MSNLGQHLKFSNGKTSPDRTDTGFYPVYGANGIIGYSSEYNSDENTIIIGRVGSYCGSVHFSDKKCWVTDNAISARSMNLKESIFWFYYLKSLNLNSMRVGSGQPLLNQTILKSISLPDLNINKIKVGEILLSFDQKIDLNTQINQTLAQITQALFKSWFVDFEPVHAKVQTLSDGLSLEQAELAAMQAISGKTPEELTALSQAEPDRYAELAETAKAFPCEMVEVDGVEMPKGWEYCSFGDVSECFDSKRIPLSKQQREKRKGNIPYYGATSVMDYVDEAIFDDIYLLVGEDGSVLKEDGTPFTQYIWGKSWVNNHAHILKGRNGISTEHLMIFIQQTNISAYITGAVQLKLNQKNMNSIPFLRANNAINAFFAEYIESLYAKIRKNFDENKVLEATRDLLLPKLLSGNFSNGKN
ncbi:type I restriction modification DNA specificity domain protein [Haemophilus sputorum HK 2154]|uniref:restriction endonuclease subunit S n=1 Tax=Haemophilus sputorum TaxID=1078480 RepID=UPI00027A65DC|nr:restriction endonuclease subunit S [Haemophilus sputorum]EJP30890.1 type I restriction modification DNA specificity domain protein [Haemophilus sputorum HK 2154]